MVVLCCENVLGLKGSMSLINRSKAVARMGDLFVVEDGLCPLVYASLWLAMSRLL